MKMIVGIIVIYITACAQPIETEGITKSDAAIPPGSAAKFIGEIKIVCGVVMDIKYERWKWRQPTTVTIGTPGSEQVCGVVIFGKYRNSFEKPLKELLRHKKIRAVGEIELHHGIPRIVIDDPGKLEIVWSAAKTDT
jgi:hypothetical protein